MSGASKPAVSEHLRDRRTSDAVQRGVDDPQVAGAVLHQAGSRVEVVVEDPLADERAGAPRGRSDGVPTAAIALGDLDVGRRHDLAAVAEVDLVAVVLRRVVAGGDHDAGDAAELADGVGEHRGGQRARQQGRRSRRRHDLGGVAGELVGVVARVVADHHGATAVAGVLEVGREAGRRARDHDPVHPVGAGAERAAQARRAELEGAGETVGEVGLLAALGRGEHGLELGAGLLVGVLGDPGAGLLDEGVQIGHGRTLSPPPGLGAMARVAVDSD
jgi:hypothetical protein